MKFASSLLIVLAILVSSFGMNVVYLLASLGLGELAKQVPFLALSIVLAVCAASVGRD